MGDYKGNKLRVFQGKMIAYVEATGEPGIATVNFTSTWLKGAEVEIEIK
jgi:beta-galactosidase